MFKLKSNLSLFFIFENNRYIEIIKEENFLFIFDKNMTLCNSNFIFYNDFYLNQ